jgi:hypothetical protein
MTGAVRVIRILEYVYPDHETAEEDMRRWNIPENGSVRLGGGTRHIEGRRETVKSYIITSATTSPRTVGTDETVPLLDDAPQTCKEYVRVHGVDRVCGQKLTGLGVCKQMHMHAERPS